MTRPRVVVTGLGAISPVGLTARGCFDALVRGECGVAACTFELDGRFEVRIAAEIKRFDAVTLFGKRAARRNARFSLLALAAAQQARLDAGLDTAGYEPERIGTVLGVGMGGLEVLHDCARALDNEGPGRVSPFGLQALIPNIAAGLVSMEAGARGPCKCISTACASSADAIGDAMRLLRDGNVDAVITGGAEAAVTPLGIAAFSRMGALSFRNEEPKRASRPFDADRDGFVMGEGAAVLVLERLDHARARGAKIYGEVAGYGAAGDAHHVTQPADDGRGAVAAMSAALRDADLHPRDVDYVNAHGTSTPLNDLIETRALKTLFGPHAYDVTISSTKGATGHLLGAAGAFEAIVGLLAIKNGVIPPTLNLDHPGDECDLDYVPQVARQRRSEVVLSNSFGFGGHNATLVLKSIEAH